jgi:methylated-DNA-[protein]-cysteine S-methyltransferase
VVAVTSIEPMELEYWHQPSPLGSLLCVASPAGLAAVLFGGDDQALARVARAFGPVAVTVERARPDLEKALAAYFDGDLAALEGLPVDLTAVTGWRRQVLEVLRAVGPGQLVTYGELAARSGRPGAARATGQAVGANPIAVVVPCHRVVASDGTLGGYAGGLARKQWLLAHEGVAARP